MKHPLSPVEKVPSLNELRRDTHSRRAFLARMGAAGLGVAAISLLQGCDGDSGPSNGGGNRFPIRSSFAPGRNDNQRVLNYALQLETLEADLYRQALNIAAGVPDPRNAPLRSSPDQYQLVIPSGGLDNFETQAGFEYLREFAFVEAAHRDFLRTQLGQIAIQPNPTGYNFGGPVNADLNSILTALLPLEEVGVRAYLGAVPFITDLSIAQVAAAIYSTEARHSASLRLILDVEDGGGVGPSIDADVPGYPPSKTVVPLGGNVDENTFELFLTPTDVAGENGRGGLIAPLLGPGTSS